MSLCPASFSTAHQPILFAQALVILSLSNIQLLSEDNIVTESQLILKTFLPVQHLCMSNGGNSPLQISKKIFITIQLLV
ncbi:hypothetical protein D3C78_896670 [compost metagenome]